MDEHVMPECYADTVLIGKLVPPKHRYNHKKGCTNVAKEMKEGNLSNTFAIGIIDKDKREVKYLEEFDKLTEVKDSLILWKHKNKPQFIIQICPVLEKWILAICEKANMEIEDFGFSKDIKELMRATKSIVSSKDARINSLCAAIAKREDIEPVQKLKGWLKYLKEKNYQFDINELKNV